MEINIIIQLIGMMLDGFGAYLIMRGYKNIKLESILKASQQSFGTNGTLRIMLSEQKADGLYGGILLIVGFLLMFVSTLANSIDFLTNELSVLSSIIIFVCVICFGIYYINYFVANKAKKINDEVNELSFF